MDVKNALLCQYWGIELRKYMYDHCQDASDKLIQAAVRRFQFLSRNHDRTDILFETVALTVTSDCTSVIPEYLFDSINEQDLFCTLQKSLCRLKQTKLKEKVLVFLFKNYGFPASTVDPQWLYNEGILSPDVYQLLFRLGMKKPHLEFLKKIVANDKFDILNVLMALEDLSKGSIKELVHFAFKGKKTSAACIILQRINPWPDDVMKAVVKNFNKQFVSKCSPQIRGELINFCFSRTDPGRERRKSVIIDTLSSGEIDTTNIDFRSIFRYSLPILLSDTTILNKLFDVGLALEKDNEAVMSVLQGKDQMVERVDLICTLLQKGADITGLKKACSQGGSVIHAATILALQTKNIKILELAYSKGSVSDVRTGVDKLGSTPLHIVTKQKKYDQVSIEICRFLCQVVKVDPTIKDRKDNMASDYCTSKQDERLAILCSAQKLDTSCTPSKSVSAKTSAKTEESYGKGHKASGSSKVKQEEKIEKPKSTKLTPDQQQHSDLVTSPTPMKSILSKDNDLEALLKSVLEKDRTYFSSKKPRVSQSILNEEEKGSEQVLENEVLIKEKTNKQGNTAKCLTKKDEVKYDVFYSPRVKKFIETGQQDLVNRTLQIIQRLACGESNYTLVRKLYGSLYHSNIDKAKRIIWHKKITYSPLKRKQCKVLVIIDVVLDHNKLEKATEEAANWIKRGKEEGGTYKVRCIAKGTPSFYELHNESSECAAGLKDVPYMMKDEYGAVPIYSLPEYVLSKITNGNSERFGLPLKLSHEEHAIVDMNFQEETLVNMSHHEKTLLVVGRSGTGKTTCCLLRLWEEFLHYWETLSDEKDPVIPRLRNKTILDQAEDEEIENMEQPRAEAHMPEKPEKEFLTNQQEMGTTKVLEPGSSEQEPTGEDCTMKAVQFSTSENDCDHLHQVFVTKSPYLCREVKRRFYDLVSGHELLRDHVSSEHKPLPTSLESNDISFPLFMTSRELLLLIDSTLQNNSFFQRKNGKLLDNIKNSELIYHDEDLTDMLEDYSDEEEDEEDSENEQEDDVIGNDGLPPQKEETRRQLLEVTASYFKEHIWSEINSQGGHNIDPILVWQEIKSFIKGSVEALRSKVGYLSEDEYLKIGKSKAPNFTRCRGEVYSLFLKYQQYCSSPTDKGQRYFDECDLLFHLYQHREKLPWVIHNFYIDEVQDFTEAELFLLLSNSQCPNGNFLCGDSAQSIMRGVSFRFTDVRSLFHELKQSFQCDVVVPDKPHYLTVNYRAHAGILTVADSVIELLDQFFKDSFDAIPESFSTAHSSSIHQRPLLLYYDDPDQLPFMLAGNQMGATREIEFGAHQAIIIPTKETQVPKSLQGAIVLTVLEAKGLEFNDVLLFNFFTDTKVHEKSWELVSAYTCIEVEKSTDKIANKYERVLEKFDESQHKMFNTELKYLYTAITRAKRNLWICDRGNSDESNSHPMYQYLLKKGLVRKFKLIEGESGVVFTTEESTKDDWKKAGDFLIKKHLWDQAIKCFLKAQAEARLHLVHAYMEFEKKNYSKAATSFLAADEIEHDTKLLVKAAKCLNAAKLYGEAGQLFEQLGKVTQAGEAYLRAKDTNSFIRVSESRKFYNRVVKRLLARGEKFCALKKAVQYGNAIKLKDFSVEKLAYECVKICMSKGSKDAVKEAVTHLGSPVLKIKYLVMNGFYEDALFTYVESDNYSGAYEHALQCGLYKHGVDIAREHGDSLLEAQFLLCEVYAKLTTKMSQQGAKDALMCLQRNQLLRKSKDDSFKLILAQALLLQAKIDQNRNVCLEAIEIFEELSIEAGVIEAVNVLLMMGCDSTMLPPNEILAYSLRAVRLSKLFIKKSDSLSPKESQQISFYLRLNQMQKLVRGVFIPPCQAYWLPSVGSEVSVSLETKIIYKTFHDHLQSFCKKWLTSTNAIKNRLSEFRLHKEVKKKGLIPAKADLVFTKYLSSISLIVELNEALGCFPESQTVLTGLFSPLSVLHNHAWKRNHLVSLQARTAIIDSFKKEFGTMLSAQSTFTSLDQCMKLWRLSLITTSNTSFLHQCLLRNSAVPTEFINRQSQHIFVSWINFSYLLSTKHCVLSGLRTIHSELILPLAKHSIILKSISDENLLYILMIQSLSSIFLVSLAWRKRFFIPQIFKFAIRNFDFLTNQNRSSYSLIKACVAESKVSKVDLGREALKLLRFLHEFLLQNNCYILFRVINNGSQSGDHTLTMYYFALILTISANIFMARPTLENESTHHCLISLVTNLETILNTTTKPHFAEYVYNRLKNATAAQELFDIVQGLLCDVKNTDILQVSPNLDGSYLNLLIMGRYDTYPRVLLKQPLTPIYKPLQAEQTLSLEAVGETDEVFEAEDPDTEVTLAMTSEQQEDFISKLRENMIENDVCKICNVEIHEQASSEESQGGFERQDSAENDYDRHIASSNHVQKKREYHSFSKARTTFNYLERDVLRELERLQRLINLSPEDDIKLTEEEEKISSIHNKVENIVQSNESWVSMTQQINDEKHELNRILTGLNNMYREVSYNRSTGATPFDHDTTAEEDSIRSPVLEVLPEIESKRERKKQKK